MDPLDFNEQKKRRWYDNNQKMSKAIESLLLFPPEVQKILFEGVDMLVKREFHSLELENEYRTLGQDKILGIYKSKQRRRGYDQIPEIHRAMNQILVLSDEKREFVANQILKLILHFKTFLSLCKENEYDPTRENVNQVTNTFVEHGEEAILLPIKNG